jgi:hypothetical protein
MSPRQSIQRMKGTFRPWGCFTIKEPKLMWVMLYRVQQIIDIYMEYCGPHGRGVTNRPRRHPQALCIARVDKVKRLICSTATTMS